MIVLRSLVFNTVFYANLIVQMVFWTPYYFLSPRHRAWFVPKFWARTCVWLHEKIAGAKPRYRAPTTCLRARSSSPRNTSPSGMRSLSSRFR